MIKYVETEVTFAEVPDEISLCISISNCPNNCPGCHSSYLAKNIGEELTPEIIARLIQDNKGITCVCLMGGDSSPKEIDEIAKFIRSNFHLAVCWYSGNDQLSSEVDVSNFDYIKIGGYKEQYGGLSNPRTNQRFYHIVDGELIDRTDQFWK